MDLHQKRSPKEGRKLTADFFGKTSAVMIGCYAGIIIFSVADFNIPGAGNIAGAVMYLGLFILFII